MPFCGIRFATYRARQEGTKGNADLPAEDAEPACLIVRIFRDEAMFNTSHRRCSSVPSGICVARTHSPSGTGLYVRRSADVSIRQHSNAPPEVGAIEPCSPNEA